MITFILQNNKLISEQIIIKGSYNIYNIQHHSQKILNIIQSMQKIGIVHNCLTFEYKKQKYVYGLTLAILNSNYLIKYKPNYIILPSEPFIYRIFAHAGLQYLLSIIGKKNRNREIVGQKQVGKEKDRQATPLSNYSTRQEQQPCIVDKILKFSKIILCDSKKLKQFYPIQLVDNALQAVELKIIGDIKQLQLQEDLMVKQLIRLIQQQNRIYSNDNEQGQKEQELKISNKSLANSNRVPKIDNKQQQKQASLLNWINCPNYQLKIIVPQSGMTTYLVHGSSIVAVDPTQQFVYYLNNQYTKLNRPTHSNFNKQLSNIKVREIIVGQFDNRIVSLLHAVVITKMSSVMAVLGLMIADGVDKVRVLVVSEQLESAIIQKGYKYLKYTQEVIRSRLLIRRIFTQTPQQFIKNQTSTYKYPVISNNSPYEAQSPNNITCFYNPLSQDHQSTLQIHFGSSVDLQNNKRVIFYTPTPSRLMSSLNYRNQLDICLQNEIEHFPKDISDNNVDFIVIWKMNEELGKQLKALPQQLRKKIIYNRSQHKYSHKYFFTFEKNKVQHCTVTNIQYMSLLTNKLSISKNTNVREVFCNLKQNQVRPKNMMKANNLLSVSPGSKIYEMGDNAQMETIGQVVRVIDGFLEVQRESGSQMKEKQSNSINKSIVGAHQFKNIRILRNIKKIRALKFAQVQIIMQSDYKILQSIRQHNSPNHKKSKTPKPKLEHLSTISNNILIQSLTQTQKQQLNSICHPVTYEVGYKMNNRNTHVYFINKGGMKWEDSEKVAGSGFYIGDMQSYYRIKSNLYEKLGDVSQQQIQEQQQLQFDNFIEVIKDTWALQINIEEFHQFVILKNPHLLHFIYTKGRIFN